VRSFGGLSACQPSQRLKRGGIGGIVVPRDFRFVDSTRRAAGRRQQVD
jgi:hypothetical protein